MTDAPSHDNAPHTIATSLSAPLTRAGVRSATLIAAGLIAAAIASWLAGHSLRTEPLRAFLPCIVSVVVVTDLLSAYVFLGQYLRHGVPGLRWLGIAYLCSGFFALPYLLVFPGLFPFAQTLHAGEQTSLVLWMAWHAAFPIFAAVSTMYAAGRARRSPSPRPLEVAVLVGTVAFAVALVTIVALRDGAFLPVLVRNGSFSPATLEFVLPAILVLDAIALTAILRARSHSETSAWVALAVVASMLDATMGLISSRYTFGWYAGKIFSTVSASIVLVAYIREMLNLQLRLSRSREELGRFEILSEHARDIMIFADRQTLQIMYVNAAATSAFGYSAREFRSLTIQDLTLAAERDELPSRIDPAEDGALHSLTCLRKDAGTFAGEFSARTAVVDGREIVLCVIRDVTERQRSRELLTEALFQAVSASTLKSNFVATMSHEIRTPMNGVIGMSEILLGTNLDLEQREFVETIRDSGQALLRVVNDVLDFSKIEAGKLDIEAVEFSVESIVEGVVMLLRRTEHAATVSTFVDPEIPRVLRGDPGRLRQVLFNIVGNALKFTPAGEVAVSAVCEARNTERAVVRFTVRDSGIGMDEKAMAKLFEPFVQGDDSTTRRFGGTGLGLSIAKRLIELMGGTIEVQSEPGAGTTFSFTASFGDGIAQRAEERPSFTKLRVLIADDDDAANRTLGAYASAWQMESAIVRTAPDALEALANAAAAGAPFDVAVIGARLAGVAEGTLCRRIASNARYGAVKIIMLASFEEVARYRRSQSAFVSAFVVKPIVQSQVFDAIALVTAAQAAPHDEPLRASVAAKPAGTGAPAAVHRSGSRILVVEDNAINRRVAGLQLSKLGYAYEMAFDGREALAKVHAQPFDLILMDCHMPEMDGYETTAAIRASPLPAVRAISIVAMTAGALERDRQRCLDAGMDDHITKPVRLDDLRQALEKRLAQSIPASLSG